MSPESQVKYVQKAYKYRIWPTEEQVATIEETFRLCRFTYNKFLALRKYEYARFKKPDETPVDDEFEMMLSFAKRRKDGRADLGRFGMSNILTRYKKVARYAQSGEFVYPQKSGSVDAMAFVGTLAGLDAAYKRYFDNVKKDRKSGRGYGYPRFKSRKNPVSSYLSHNQSVKVDVERKLVYLRVLGWVCFDAHIEPLGHIQQATVSRDAVGNYYVSLSCKDVPVEVYPHTGSSVGVDLGVKALATCSDGTVYGNEKFAYHAERRKRRLDRARSRRQPKRGEEPSKRYLKKKRECAKWNAKVANRRSNAIHQITHDVVKGHDLVAIEDLNVTGMLKNRHLSTSIADASFGEVRRQLEYKADWHDRVVVKVDRFYPSSKTCSVCGHVQDMPLSKRTYVCPVCGNVMDRDLNAAVNIEREGERLLAECAQRTLK